MRPLSRPVRLLHPRFPLYVVPRGDGVFMLGATQIESGARGGATLRSVVELLNAGADGPADFLDVTDATHACIECHGKGGRGDSSTRMTCVRCHQFERTHP